MHNNEHAIIRVKCIHARWFSQNETVISATKISLSLDNLLDSYLQQHMIRQSRTNTLLSQRIPEKMSRKHFFVALLTRIKNLFNDT